MTEQQCVRLLCIEERRGAEPGEGSVVRRRDDDHRIEAEIDVGAGISDRLRQAGRRGAGDGGEGAADAGGVKDIVRRLAIDAGLVDEGQRPRERCGAADEKLARGARRDFDRQGAGRTLRVVAAHRQHADAAARRDDTATHIRDIADDGAVARERAAGADRHVAGDRRRWIARIADFKHARRDRPIRRRRCRAGQDPSAIAGLRVVTEALVLRRRADLSEVEARAAAAESKRVGRAEGDHVASDARTRLKLPHIGAAGELNGIRPRDAVTGETADDRAAVDDGRIEAGNADAAGTPGNTGRARKTDRSGSPGRKSAAAASRAACADRRGATGATRTARSTSTAGPAAPPVIVLTFVRVAPLATSAPIPPAPPVPPLPPVPPSIVCEIVRAEPSVTSTPTPPAPLPPLPALPPKEPSPPRPA